MYVCREVHSVIHPLVAGQVFGGGGRGELPSAESSKQGRPGGARGHRGSAGAAGQSIPPPGLWGGHVAV